MSFIDSSKIALKIQQEAYKIEYLDELSLKLKQEYAKGTVDTNFFDKAMNFLGCEKTSISSSIIGMERSLYIDEIDKINNFRDLEIIEKLIRNNLRYRLENQSVVVSYLNERFKILINDEDVRMDFEFADDLYRFLNNADILINKENKTLASKVLSQINSDTYQVINTDINKMSLKEREKYLEIQKNGIRLRLMEAKTFENLEIVYGRIKENIDSILKNDLKDQFAKIFFPLFKISSVYFLIQKYNQNGLVNLENIKIKNDKIILSTSSDKISVTKYECDIRGLNYLDELELSYLNKILKMPYDYFKDEFIKEELSSIISIPKKLLDKKDRIIELNKFMNSILNKDKHRFFRTTITTEYDSSFEQKIVKAKKNFGYSDSENVVLIFDNTLFRTLENGFIITDKNVYIKNMDNVITKIDISSVDNISVESEFIYIDKNKIECGIIPSEYRESFKQVILIVMYIVQNYNEIYVNIDEIKNDIMAIL